MWYYMTLGVYSKNWCIVGTEEYEFEADSNAEAIEIAKNYENECNYKNTMVDELVCEDGTELNIYNGKCKKQERGQYESKNNYKR